MDFWLTTHATNWLWDGTCPVPLMVNAPRLSRTRRVRPATTRWVLDSGGFSELSNYGTWTIPARDYAASAAAWQRDIGGLEWAAIQDWMCEPQIRAQTGLTTEDHQQRTVRSYLDLTSLWPEYSDTPSPFIPVLQGWTIGDYLHCAGLYAAAGVDLTAAPVVGLGSVCRRQNTTRIGAIVAMLAGDFRLHGFGVKTDGLAGYGQLLASADSLSWSLDTRRGDPLPGHAHKTCANCLDYALAWRDEVLAHSTRPPLAA